MHMNMYKTFPFEFKVIVLQVHLLLSEVVKVEHFYKIGWYVVVEQICRASRFIWNAEK
jgi:hypothetical protein